MSRQGFRFVHATCLCLDEHLVGTGMLSAEDRELAEDATFRAWDSIVETCLAAQVEFLLLTGNSFNTRTNSLRARVALEKGFEKLAAQDISVFIVPGHLDPASAWKRSVHFPPNVTLLSDEDHEPVAVIREQRVIASIHVIATANSDETRWNDGGPPALNRHQAPFRIGLVAAGTPVAWDEGRPIPVDLPGVSHAAATLIRSAIEHHTDYIALGEGHPRTEYFAAGLAHDPGCAQSLSNQIIGTCGCSVVDVSSTNEVTIDAVAAAPVRWEEFSLTAEPSSGAQDLAERMALALMDRLPEDGERLWIVSWKLSGSGHLLDSLAQPASQQDLFRKVEADLRGAHNVRRVHRIERGGAPKASASASRESGTGLLRDFQQMVQESPEMLLEQVCREILELNWMKNSDVRSLKEAIQHMPRHRITKRAQALAAHWLD
jgi:DNA repair exonuclease SbcCD nuclease subunit